MSLSDCEKCWNTPCTCGHEYKSNGKEYMAKFLADITTGRDPGEAEWILEKALEDVRGRVRADGIVEPSMEVEEIPQLKAVKRSILIGLREFRDGDNQGWAMRRMRACDKIDEAIAILEGESNDEAG